MRHGEERSNEQNVVSYCAVVVHGRRFAPPVLRFSGASLLAPPHLFPDDLTLVFANRLERRTLRGCGRGRYL